MKEILMGKHVDCEGCLIPHWFYGLAYRDFLRGENADETP